MNGYIHTHPGSGTLPIFSPDDLSSAYETVTAVNPSTGQPITDVTKFVLGVTTKNGDSYFMTIQDLDSFKKFYEDYLDEQTRKKDFQFEDFINSNTSSIDAELQFLKIMISSNAGIGLLKSNNSFTSFSELTLGNHNSQVISSVCN